MKTLKHTVMGALLVAVVATGLTGCACLREKRGAEHPEGEHPKAEHPEGEHPK
ncbi:MAG: hypothetical protein HQ559_14030 [Lentisphaerae bacterium]|nr:hypothetical protein [Lentisphaerota bacterium]